MEFDIEYGNFNKTFFFLLHKSNKINCNIYNLMLKCLQTTSTSQKNSFACMQRTADYWFH